KGNIPIFAWTAHAMAGAREQYIRAGMNDYVSKPIEPAVLFSKLENLAKTLKSEKDAKPAKAEPTVEPDGAASQAVDPACLTTLESMMSPEDVEEFLHLYLDQAEERVSRIRTFSTKGELTETAREAHTLVGTAGNVGAKRVSDIARSIEEACKAGDPATAG